MDLDQASREIQQRLHQLSDEQVLAVADHLRIPEKDQEKVRGKGKNGGLRLINRFLSREEVDDMEDGGLQMLVELNVFVGEFLGTKEEKEDRADATSGKTKEANNDAPTYQPSPLQGQALLWGHQ